MNVFIDVENIETETVVHDKILNKAMIDRSFGVYELVWAEKSESSLSGIRNDVRVALCVMSKRKKEKNPFLRSVYSCNFNRTANNTHAVVIDFLMMCRIFLYNTVMQSTDANATKIWPDSIHFFEDMSWISYRLFWSNIFEPKFFHWLHWNWMRTFQVIRDIYVKHRDSYLTWESTDDRFLTSC